VEGGDESDEAERHDEHHGGREAQAWRLVSVEAQHIAAAAAAGEAASSAGGGGAASAHASGRGGGAARASGGGAAGGSAADGGLGLRSGAGHRDLWSGSRACGEDRVVCGVRSGVKTEQGRN
jgi:hypothetical protein